MVKQDNFKKKKKRLKVYSRKKNWPKLEYNILKTMICIPTPKHILLRPKGDILHCFLLSSILLQPSQIHQLACQLFYIRLFERLLYEHLSPFFHTPAFSAQQWLSRLNKRKRYKKNGIVSAGDK
jgi:hypothetical protein